MYSGKGLIPQGYDDPLNFVKMVRRSMKQAGRKYLTVDLFSELVTRGNAILRTSKNRVTRIRKIYDILLSYASDPAKGLAVSELGKVPLRIWAKPASEGDQEGPLP